MADGAGHDNTRAPSEEQESQEVGADLGEVGGVESAWTHSFTPGSPLYRASRDPVSALAMLVEACERGETNLRAYLDAGRAAIDYDAEQQVDAYLTDGPSR